MRTIGGSCTGTRGAHPCCARESGCTDLAQRAERQPRGFWGDHGGPRARTQDLDLILMRERMSDELSSNPW